MVIVLPTWMVRDSRANVVMTFNTLDSWEKQGYLAMLLTSTLAINC